jgi:hypothetical protein
MLISESQLKKSDNFNSGLDRVMKVEMHNVEMSKSLSLRSGAVEGE